MSRLQEARRRQLWQRAGVIWEPESKKIIDLIDQGFGVVLEGKTELGRAVC